MTTDEFIQWVQQYFGIKNRTAAVDKAAQLLSMSPSGLWKYLAGERVPPRHRLFYMQFLVKNPPPREK